MKVLSIIVFAILSIVVSQPSSDKVTKLPGYVSLLWSVMS